jgi:hypothetical protein
MGVRGGAIHSMDEYLIVEQPDRAGAAFGACHPPDSPLETIRELSSPPCLERGFPGHLRDGEADGRRLHQSSSGSRGLVEKLIRSEKGFQRAREEQSDDLFMMVLENVEQGTIRGTCQVFGMVGSDCPFYSYRLTTLRQTSQALGKTFKRRC